MNNIIYKIYILYNMFNSKTDLVKFFSLKFYKHINGPFFIYYYFI